MKSKPTIARQRPKLDRAAIIDAAIARIERHGLEELSARKLAQDLGCEAMSLYHHVANMEALKDAIVDRLIATIAPAGPGASLEDLRLYADDYLGLAVKYARSFQLVATRRWKGKSAIDAATSALESFKVLGLSADEALARARALGAYLNGAGLALAAWAADPDAPAADARRVQVDLRHGLDLLFRSLVEPGPVRPQ
ncbi:MAG TPA: TetR family transcriptional regulator [Pseudolabrys sp.]|nr:TetR family transcriptional regulator [Pseudolabrys sp.]